jgi:hypothetical protein
LKAGIQMAIGALQMYMDMDIANDLCRRFGSTQGMNTARFFEELRNYGWDYLTDNYPERTFYHHLRMLIQAGYVERLGKSEYRIKPGLEEPIRLR